MKSNFLKLIMFSFFAVTLTFQSCTPDPCKDVECQNGAICEDGFCNCEVGYEGDVCETTSRTKFLATYNATDECDLDPDAITYVATLTESSQGIDKIIVNEAYGYEGANVIAEVQNNTMVIADQPILGNTDLDGWRMQGTGSINSEGNEVTLNYTVTDTDGNSDNCTVIYTKQ